MKGNKYLVFAILKHIEDFNLGPNEIIDLIQSSHSVELINKCLKNPNLIADNEIKRKLMDIKESFLTRTVYSKKEDGTVYESGEVRYTEDELDAIRLYIGENIGSKFYTGDDKTYTVINGLMKPGKVFAEIGPPKRRTALCNIINNPQEFLEVCGNLYSAMHKYGKTISTPIHAIRAESAVDDLLNSGKTRSFFSMTIGKDVLQYFSRDSHSELETDIEFGTDCMSIAEILQGDYSMANESELLVAPYISFESEILDEKQVEIEFYRGNYKVSKKRCQLRFAYNEKTQILSQEDREDYQKYFSIFMDESIRAAAINYVKNWNGQMYGDGLQEYSMWREAFQKVFEYRQREIALAIDETLVDKGITFQQVGQGTVQSFTLNPEKAINVFNTLEQGVNKQEERTDEQVKGVE